MEVALLGGSFNPPHVGHLLAAVYVHATLPVDQVWLVPTFKHPFGKPHEPFEHRVAMCRALGEHAGPWLQVSLAESQVAGQGRTVELLDWLLPRHPGLKFRFVIGSDILKDLPLWKDWERIQTLVQVTVLHRAGYPAPEALGPPLALVSSSEIRGRLEQGQVPSDLVPRRVLEYAREHRLYGLG